MQKINLPNFESSMLYAVKSESYANLDITLDGWIKFLSYINSEELEFLKETNKKSIEQLTSEEGKKYLKLKEQIEMAALFKKYKNNNCTKEEHDKVDKYMDNSLKTFMASKLTEEELDNLYKLSNKYSKMSEFELKEYINLQMSNYESLTLSEAYILYLVKDIREELINRKTNENIVKDLRSRENCLIKSLTSDYGPYCF